MSERADHPGPRPVPGYGAGPDPLADQPTVVTPVPQPADDASRHPTLPGVARTTVSDPYAAPPYQAPHQAPYQDAHRDPHAAPDPYARPDPYAQPAPAPHQPPAPVQGPDADAGRGRGRRSGGDEPAGTRPVPVRRADSLAAALLLLAGLAAGVSLLLRWTPGGPTGQALASDGVERLRTDWTEAFAADLWQPAAVLGGGALLFLLGLLLLVPARAHRFLGVLALLVSLVVAAAVLVPLADRGWDLAGSTPGAWATLAVAALGLLGALKAALTGRKHAG